MATNAQGLPANPVFVDPLAPRRNQAGGNSGQLGQVATQQTDNGENQRDLFNLEPINTVRSNMLGQSSQTTNAQQTEEAASRLGQLVSAGSGFYDDSIFDSSATAEAGNLEDDLFGSEAGGSEVNYDYLFEPPGSGDLAGGLENQESALQADPAPGISAQEFLESLNSSSLLASPFGPGPASGTYPLVGTPSESGSERSKRGRDESDDGQDGPGPKRARLDGQGALDSKQKD
ncbi:hypothetical protein CDD81_1361 [Ophiocordyceps australis]|uniref:Uncharacterized protein n=1 Tax=Ophiocordyceps australis TaxID=1399860 RepID=A0A2C5XTS8_9HYPO|nr:hypothetical protein CDD81_1361 [Ophiocordyceps australis]